MKIINENWMKFISEADFDTSNLHPKENLHPSFWRGTDLNSKIQARLLKIANDLIAQLDLTDLIDDIILTGSIAAYTWHNLSDIDLHIILDFAKIDENTDLVKQFLDSKRMIWNKAHNIKIKGHEVEIYFQDIKEKHQSLGLFSLKTGQWLKNPEKLTFDFDISAIKSKAEAIAVEIEEIQRLFGAEKTKEAYNLAIEIKEKVKKLRQSGLSRDGVNSVENLAFKLLRNNDFLRQLHSLKVLSYDKMMSANGFQQQVADIRISIQENWQKFIKNV